ncbi:MAG: sulfotransferase family 2 domain-containing protein [Hyphomicrobiaceae bacterium]|nr:sulfotransferase family 2 domain-containing protein [Hyphomicrobiaceae bacterium]
MQTLAKASQKRINRLRYNLQMLARRISGEGAPRRVVFLHIPKCAGSSVNALFKGAIGSSRSARVELIDDRIASRDLERRIEAARSAQFVGGHFGKEVLEAVRGDAFTFTVLRDPFDRLRSTYGHFHTRREGNPLAHKVPRMTIEEYIASEDPEILQWTDNVIARQLAISHDRARSLAIDPELMVERAIANLARFDMIAMLGTLDVDIAAAAAAAGVPYKGAMPEENVTANRASKRSQQALSSLDQSLRDLAAPRVQLDLAVYEAAQAQKAKGPTADIAAQPQ